MGLPQLPGQLPAEMSSACVCFSWRWLKVVTAVLPVSGDVCGVYSLQATVRSRPHFVFPLLLQLLSMSAARSPEGGMLHDAAVSLRS